MNLPVSQQNEPLIAKLEEVLVRVGNLREQVAAEADSLLIIQEAGVVRTCLDELEKLVFERFSRECFMSAMDKDMNDVGELLVVLNRWFK